MILQPNYIADLHRPQCLLFGIPFGGNVQITRNYSYVLVAVYGDSAIMLLEYAYFV